MSELLEIYPFLRALPTKVNHVDFFALLVPEDALLESMRHFDLTYNCRSVLYQTFNDTLIPRRSQLCRHIQTAALKPKAFQELQELESTLPEDTAIVVYASPLQTRKYRTTPCT